MAGIRHLAPRIQGIQSSTHCSFMIPGCKLDDPLAQCHHLVKYHQLTASKLVLSGKALPRVTCISEVFSGTSGCSHAFPFGVLLARICNCGVFGSCVGPCWLPGSQVAAS